MHCTFHCIVELSPFLHVGEPAIITYSSIRAGSHKVGPEAKNGETGTEPRQERVRHDLGGRWRALPAVVAASELASPGKTVWTRDPVERPSL